ncbi:MAG: hypothetical protein AB1426_08920 [Bacillota bacterium]
MSFRNLEPARPLNFQLTVSSPLKIYSNLPETGANTFAGEVSGPTVMAGKLLEVRVDGYRIIAPPDIVRRIPVLMPELREGVRAVAVVLTRRLVYTYLLVAVFSVGEWDLASLRFGLQTLPAGGGAAAFNPFQLAQPAPGSDPLVVSFVLFIAAVFLLSCGQMLFTRCGYLLR